MWTCKFCNETFDFQRTTEKGNHARHCRSNPAREQSNERVKIGKSDAINRRLGAFKDFQVMCEICGDYFVVCEREFKHPKRDKYYCSISCSRAVGGRAKSAKHHTDDKVNYTVVAWRHHIKKCVVCGEDKVVAVHHYDNNHENNDPGNLVPLCPTHHIYIHSKYKFEILEKIESYLLERWGSD